MRNNIDREVYEAHAGSSWPSYTDFVNGKTPNEVADEIKQFVADHKDDGLLFPIKTATACQSKWTWNTLWLNEGITSSCHRAGWDNVNVEDFNLHNGPNKLKARKQMLEGKWPGGGCEYCRDIERAGGHSDRQHNNLIPGLNPPELETNPTEIVVTQRIQEIFADNTCNLSCLYCNSNLSSQIERENNLHGEFRKKGVWLKDTLPTKKDNQALYAKFLEWLTDNIHHLRRLHLLGGETFVQHKLMNDIFSIVEQKPNPELKLCIFSNMNAPEKYWNEYTTRIKELPIKGFDLTVSVDCWGPQASYIRYGLDLDILESRLAWASEQGDWLALNVNQTVTNMTIKTMAGLLEVVNRYNKNKHIGHYFEYYIGPEQYQHPKIFAYDMWQEDFDRIFAVMPTQTTEHNEAVLRMQGLQQQLKQVTTNDYVQIENLHIYLDEIDRRRGTNWRQLFPYLDIHE